MTDRASQLLQQALSLSEEERAELASSLLESLEPAAQEGAEQAWEAEVARRVDELDSGKVKPVPWPEIRERLYTKFGNG